MLPSPPPAASQPCASMVGEAEVCLKHSEGTTDVDHNRPTDATYSCLLSVSTADLDVQRCRSAWDHTTRNNKYSTTPQSFHSLRAFSHKFKGGWRWATEKCPKRFLGSNKYKQVDVSNFKGSKVYEVPNAVSDIRRRTSTPLAYQ